MRTRMVSHPPTPAPPPGTFFALERHARLQVVHLHLQPLQREVTLAGLSFVGDEDGNDEDDQEAAGHGDADDGGQAERAVWGDVHHPRGVLHAPDAGLRAQQVRGRWERAQSSGGAGEWGGGRVDELATGRHGEGQGQLRGGVGLSGGPDGSEMGNPAASRTSAVIILSKLHRAGT